MQASHVRPFPRLPRLCGRAADDRWSGWWWPWRCRFWRPVVPRHLTTARWWTSPSRSTRCRTGSRSSCARTTGVPIVAVNLWYHVGPGQRGGGPHRLRAPVRAHDVPGLEARRPTTRTSRASRRVGAHRLNGTTNFDRTNYFEDVPVQPARAGAVAGERPHGLPARHARPGEARQPAATSCATSAARASRTGRTGFATRRCSSTLFPEGHPYHASVIGSHEDIQAAQLDGRARLLQALLRAEQRHARDRRRHRHRGDEGAGREVLRHHPAGTARASRQVDDADGRPRSGD